MHKIQEWDIHIMHKTQECNMHIMHKTQTYTLRTKWSVASQIIKQLPHFITIPCLSYAGEAIIMFLVNYGNFHQYLTCKLARIKEKYIK